MTPEQRDRLRELAHGFCIISQTLGADWKANAAFIVACDPSTILALLDENKALRARIDELEKGK